uniref:Uncharacterized protein LOC103957694 n=1 Tax=Rhizophora mucronata TaxID=61149 RepID=A0A2P2IXY9_RHIMU
MKFVKGYCGSKRCKREQWRLQGVTWINTIG